MNVDKVVDFTEPYMEVKRGMIKIHEAMLEGRYIDAKLAAVNALADMKLMLNAIIIEEETCKNKNFIPRG
jgi:hypothetical protein